MKVLVLHGYSASNAGDGLLVHETITTIREALGTETAVSVIALHPETFSGVDAQIIDGSISRRGYSPEFRDVMKRLDRFDLLVGVGGGYLRAGYPTELAKTLIAHGYQVFKAGKSSSPSIYLPQSVGPFRLGTGPLFRHLFRKLDVLYLRDDRSMSAVTPTNATRIADLAIMSADRIARSGEAVDATPVVSVRAVRGKVSPHIYSLTKLLGDFDGYVQSTGGGNDDTEAVASTNPRSILTRQSVLDPSEPRRVIVAVRLHAALMAINAGHVVVHLAYERKGFGAFDDLNLSNYVFNVNDFSPSHVADLVHELLDNRNARDEYDARVAEALPSIAQQRERLLSDIKRVAISPTERGRNHV